MIDCLKKELRPLIVPLSEKKFNEVADFVKHALTNFSCQDVHACSKLVIFGANDSDFNMRYNLWLKSYATAGNVAPKFSSIIKNAIGRTLLYSATCLESDLFDSADKAIFSLIFKSHLILCKSFKGKVSCNKNLLEIIDQSESFLQEKNGVATKEPDHNALPKVLEVREDTSHAPEIPIEVLKFLTKKYYEQEYRERIKSFSGNNFIKAYKMAMMMYSFPWKYVDPNPIKTLAENVSQSKAKTLCEIKSLVSNDLVEMENLANGLEESSHLLKYLYGEDNSSQLDDLHLTPQEFGVYLYHELLLERILSESNDE